MVLDKLSKTKGLFTIISSPRSKPSQTQPLFTKDTEIFLITRSTRPGKLAVCCCADNSLATSGGFRSFDLRGASTKHSYCSKRLDISKLQNSINQKGKAGFQRRRNSFFKERLKTIRRSSVLKDDKTCDTESLKVGSLCEYR
jgi:hypothetical protein